ITSNPADRCYHCKRLIFSSISRCASTDGCVYIMDGTNASDDPCGRPGMRALRELGILSPLRECGITKRQVRELSREAGLPTWNRPSNSCLATRISTGILITEEGLRRTESAEDELRSIGFSDIRVRTLPDSCRFEFTEAQKGLFESSETRVRQILLKYYPSVRYSTREPGL
ncbi:MAG: TIGR00268 family protein, partial [Candidatus Methanomethylophilaceae archaeon]|nr:TIGR00268 family protein [Candidatus Methanomethylophilaceae archaeon]